MAPNLLWLTFLSSVFEGLSCFNHFTIVSIYNILLPREGLHFQPKYLKIQGVTTFQNDNLLAKFEIRFLFRIKMYIYFVLEFYKNFWWFGRSRNTFYPLILKKFWGLCLCNDRFRHWPGFYMNFIWIFLSLFKYVPRIYILWNLSGHDLSNLVIIDNKISNN